jgi:hypothetical protein
MPASSTTATSRIVEAYYRSIKIVMAVLLAAMVVLVFGNVVLRYVFNSGIAISEELSRWLFVWMVFLGAIVGLREHAHLGVDSFVKLLSPMGRKICTGTRRRPPPVSPSACSTPQVSSSASPRSRSCCMTSIACSAASSPRRS